MKCAKCERSFELSELLFKRYGMIKGTTVRQYAALCKNCREEIAKEKTQ